MSKDFSKWHAVKTIIENKYRGPFFREREIWWCSLGSNVGFEEDGKHDRFERPVLILRKFNKEMCWALPLTSREKQGAYYHVLSLHGRTSTVLLSQLRVLSVKRLIRRLGKVSETAFEELQSSMVGLIKQTDSLRSPRVPNGNL